IESTFATVRHRTIRSKGCLSNKTALAMVFKLVAFGHEFGCGDRRFASAVAVHLLGLPVDIIADTFHAGLFEVLGLDDNMLIHWNEVLALDHEFGHWIFSCWIFQRPYPCQLLSAGVVNGSVAPKRLETEFGEAFLKGGLIRNVALKRVIADAADRRELIDHQ